MPANKKYLLRTRWGRTSKVLAALLGSMLASIALHLALALWFGFKYVIPTSIFSIFIVWVGFMLVVYWIKKPWKSWILLLTVILVSTAGIILGKMYMM
ncbi:MAG: hypothetical protein AAGA86_06500 [Bacteroidota bacterium]